jgi:hypothetical protein
VVTRRGRWQPVDAHLDADRIHDTAYTCCTGKWAPDLAKRLRRNDMGCRVLSRADFEVRLARGRAGQGAGRGV